MKKQQENIRIEEVSDINFKYPYLEVFFGKSDKPFLDVGITSDKKLEFKLYQSYDELTLSFNDFERIFNYAKQFLPKALKNEDDYLKFLDND